MAKPLLKSAPTTPEAPPAKARASESAFKISLNGIQKVDAEMRLRMERAARSSSRRPHGSPRIQVDN